MPNVPGERDEKYGKDGVGLNEFTIKNAKNLFNDYGTVAKAMTGIGDTNGLVSNEFGNSVRAGMIMGVFNPMNVPGLYSEIKGLKNEIREKKNLQGLAKHMTETGQDDARISSYYDAIQNGRVDARIGMLEKEKEVETQVDGKKVTIGKKEFGEEISRLKNARAVWNQIETDASTRKLSELEKAVVFKERLQGAYKMDKILKQVRENESNMNKAEAEYMKTIVDNSGKQLDQNSKDYIKKNAQIETEMIQNETMRTLLMLDKKGLRKISREEKLSIRNNIRLNRESIKRKEKERTEAWGRLEKDKTVDPNLKAMLKDPNQIKSIHDAQKFQDYLSSIGKLNESTSEYASNHQRLMSLHSNPREILREKRKNWNKFRLDRKKEDKANVKAILDSKEDTEKKLSTLEQMKKDRLKELQDSKEINEEEVSFDKAWRQTKDPEEKKLLSLNREKSKLAKVGNSVSKAAELLLGNPFKLGKRTKAYFEKNWNHSLDRDDVITTIDEAIEEIKSGKERTAAVDANRNSGSNSGVGLTQEQNLNDLNQQQPAPVQNQSQTDDVEGSSGVNEGFGVDPDATSGSSEEQQRQEQEDYYNSLGNDSQSGNQNTREPEETGEFDPKNVSRKMSIAVRETVVGNLGIVNSLTEGERRIFSDALTWFNKRFEDFLAKTAKNKTSLDEYGDLNLLSERVQNDLELLMRFGNKILDEAAMLKLGLYTARYKNDLNQRKSNEASEPSENLDVNEVVPFENELVGKVVKELYLRKLIHDEGGRFFFSIMGVTGKKVKMEIGSKTTEEELVTMINKSLKKSSFLYPSDLIEMLQNNNEDAGNGLFSNIRNC